VLKVGETRFMGNDCEAVIGAGWTVLILLILFNF